ncbi:MAG: ATP-binding protein [Lachnospiraceae bacterium]
MIAKRIPSILPPLTLEGVSGSIRDPQHRRYTSGGRDPDGAPVSDATHTISAVALTGGGAVPRPGEISLAHRGVSLSG